MDPLIPKNIFGGSVPQPSPSSGRTYVIIFVFNILMVVALFAAVTFYINRRGILHHEEMFQKEQELQVFLVKRAIEDHIGWLFSELNILAVHSLPEFALGKRSMDSLRDLFLTEQAAYPEHLAHVYMDAPGHVVNEIHSHTPAGVEARRIAVARAETYWPELTLMEQGHLVPPLHITCDFQMLGMLFPVRIDKSLCGVLAVTVDLKPLVQRYVVPIRSGRYGAGYLLDGRGTIGYDHEEEIIGRNVFDGLHADYPDLIRLDKRLVGELSGKDEYTFTVKRGREVSRKLIAWNTVRVGDQKLIVCLSAPDIEINHALYGLRTQQILSGVFISVLLVVMSAVFFRFRQQLLEENNRLLKIRVERQTEELMESEKRYETLFETANDAIFILDYDRFIDCNPKTLELFGYGRDQLIGMAPYELSPELQPNGQGSKEMAMEKLNRASEGESQFFVWRHTRCDATLFDAEVSLNRMELPGGMFLMAIIRDITERRKNEEKMKFLATTDELTGTYNRRAFSDYLHKNIGRAKRYKEPLSMLLLDIDHFKQVNDTHGHDAGDRILAALVRIVKGNIRHEDLLARWGGEEFTILLPQTGKDTAFHLAERLRVTVAGYDFAKPGHVTVSIGLAELKADDTSDSFVKRADNALYEAKAGGRNMVRSC